MKPWNPIRGIALAFAVLLGVSGAAAQAPGSAQELIDGIIQDVIDRAVDAARQEVRRNTGGDPLQRGYDRSRSYQPVRGDASEETRRELQKLNQEHDRKIAKLEAELARKLRKAEDEFRREAAKEDKAGKIEEKRKKLQEKVDQASAKFERKIGKENQRFDEKRSKILGK